jgi:hypothetical protein
MAQSKFVFTKTIMFKYANYEKVQISKSAKKFSYCVSLTSDVLLITSLCWTNVQKRFFGFRSPVCGEPVPGGAGVCVPAHWGAVLHIRLRAVRQVYYRVLLCLREPVSVLAN